MQQHSVFADGIKNAMELVTGEQNSVSTLCAYTNDMTEVETPIKEIIDALCDDEELMLQQIFSEEASIMNL